MKKLPIGIQTLAKIIEEDYIYIDKTSIALQLIENGEYYFLSRPRRFGKSLFLSTLKELFSGNKALFEGLYIEDKWDFAVSYPVLHIDFSAGFITKGLDEWDTYIKWILEKTEKEVPLSISLDSPKDAASYLRDLIWTAHQQYGQKVVILIDEYDKPILDNITNKEKARAVRDALKEFYTIIKQNDAYLQFVFITGVSKFSKMNLFSGLNNLNDITLDGQYGNICGYTQEDLQVYFSQHLKGVDLEKVKEWYNGYNFFGDKVYNPFDILLFLAKGKEYRNYWWGTGNPSFLIDLLKEKNYHIPTVVNYIATEEILSSFDVDTIELEALLWQTGYLTIEQKIPSPFGMTYELAIPNKEIQTSLNSLFITHLTGEKASKIPIQRSLVKVLQEGDTDGFREILENLFASIANNNYTKNKIANYEGYYASVLFAYLSSLGYPIISEDVTNKGRIDLTLQVPNKTYLFEFKVVDKITGNALQQIKSKQYYQKYQSTATSIFLIGIEFGKKERTIIGWEVEGV